MMRPVMGACRSFFAEWSWDMSKSVLVLEAADGRLRLLAPRLWWLPSLGFWVAIYLTVLLAATPFVLGRFGGWSLGVELAVRLALGLTAALLGVIVWINLGPQVVGRRPVASLDIQVHEVRLGRLTQHWTISWEGNFARILIWGFRRPLENALGRAGGIPNVT